ncbi:carboxypeptidase-like regulatory domain-containing protein [Rufibacter immobilis]|uniref:carboxypeptidase-like regulatory domain-containing protein n=1 Tax=Rufibacter immobilis TaxID=1348778 RepID=UPI0035ECAF68
MKKTFLLLFLLISVYAQAQRFQGKIVDQNGQPLPYVNVGVAGKDVGTVSTANGTFALTLPDSLNQQTLLFSAIGYGSVQYKVGDFKRQFAGQQAVIQLREQAVALKEVVVRPQKFKTKVVGNETTSKAMLVGFKSNGLGSEIGTLLKIGKPSFVEQVTFNIGHNKYDTLFLRVNIYQMGKDGPEQNLLRTPIYLNVTKEAITDGITLDVRKHNIYLESDALLSLELVRDLGEGGLWFSSGMFNSDSYYRKASQGEWTKIPVLGIGFNATVSYAK